MGGDDGVDDGKPEADPAVVRSAVWTGPPERLDQPVDRLGIEQGPGVLHFQHRVVRLVR
jgi:hypothetical protein